MTMTISRHAHLAELRRKLRDNPVVALLGARQVGKTTLAMELAAGEESVSHFDLEDPRDLARLDEPTLALEPLRGFVIIDEVQHRPELERARRGSHWNRLFGNSGPVRKNATSGRCTGARSWIFS